MQAHCPFARMCLLSPVKQKSKDTFTDIAQLFILVHELIAFFFQMCFSKMCADNHRGTRNDQTTNYILSGKGKFNREF